MEDSGGLRVDGSKGTVATSLPASKTVNQLKIVETGDNSGQVFNGSKQEMDRSLRGTGALPRQSQSESFMEKV